VASNDRTTSGEIRLVPEMPIPLTPESGPVCSSMAAEQEQFLVALETLEGDRWGSPGAGGIRWRRQMC
jgi:hypothetical protein